MVGYFRKNLEMFALVTAGLVPVALLCMATLGWPFLAVWCPLVVVAAIIQVAVVHEWLQQLQNKTFLLFDSMARLCAGMPKKEQRVIAQKLGQKVDALPHNPHVRMGHIAKWQERVTESEFYGQTVRHASAYKIAEYGRAIDHQMALATQPMPPEAKTKITEGLEAKMAYHLNRISTGAKRTGRRP